MARLLVLNAGSSTLKWVVLDASSAAVENSGTITWSGAAGSRRDAEVQSALHALGRIDAVGHRIVHGGARYRESVLIDDAVQAAIEKLSTLAPLHNPAAVSGIQAARRAFPSVPHIAVFDTAFHATLPDAAAIYPVPWEWTQRWGLRRYGFHGLSVDYSLGRATELLGTQPERLIVAHLGAGCSMTAVERGRSIDTTMGFTPLEGLMMVHRSGSVDPGLLLHVLNAGGVSSAEADRALNEASGVRGLSGVSDDMREVLAAADAGVERAELAISIFCHRAASTMGALAASLGGLDALVFTAGIGQNSARIRTRITHRLGFLGIALDAANNEAARGDRDISAPEARVRTMVIAAREDLTILRDVRRLTGM